MIKMLVMDVDGTLTDGKIYVGENGEIMKAFSVKDGLALARLPVIGIVPVIITGRQSKIVALRAMELNISEIHQKVDDKVSKMKEVASFRGLNLDEIAYIGDDENDLECMKLCAVKGCPADAAKEVLRVADFVSTKNGGDGAVREFIEHLQELNVLG